MYRSVAGQLLCFFEACVLVGLCSVQAWAAEEDVLQKARESAARQLRYDDAEREYLKLIDSGDAKQRAAASLELAELYEMLGEIEPAGRMYEQALALGSFSDDQRERLDLRTQRCRRERVSLLQFPVSVEVQDEIQQIDALLKSEQWAMAVPAIGRIVDRFRGTFLQQAPGQYIGGWQWARLKLADLPAPGRSAADEWSRKPCQESLAAGSLDAFADLARRYPSGLGLRTSLLAWADTLADQGKVGRALGLIERSEIEPAAAQQRRSHWSGHLDASARPTPNAGAANSADSQKSPRQPLSAELLLAGADAGAKIIVGGNPASDEIAIAADEGRLYVHRPFRADAFDRTGRKWLWGYEPAEPADRLSIRREVFYRGRRPKHKWAGAFDLPSIVPSPSGVLVVDVYGRGDIEAARSTVVCLDSDTGNVRWRLDRDPAFRELYVCSDPVYSAGKVLFAGTSRGEFAEFWLIAVDAEDGRLVWRKHISAGATPTNCLGRGLLFAGRSGPAVTMDQEIVYYATHMGAVLAVDRDLGEPLWAVVYPRVPRFGPMTTGMLPLLERRTSAMRRAGDDLVLLPRDLNGLLVIDRKTGQLKRTIRSLEFLDLIDADEGQAVLTTISGQVRAYNLQHGSVRWCWQSPLGPAVEDAAARLHAVRSGDEILAMQGKRAVRLSIATGKELGARDVADGLVLRKIHSDDSWAAVNRNEVCIIGAEPGRVTTPGPAVIIANGRQPARGDGWDYDAFLPARDARARLVQTGASVRLIVADQRGLAAYAPAEDYERKWWRPIDVSRGLWTASIPVAAKDGTTAGGDQPGLVAISDDRETVHLIDAADGTELASGPIEGIQPIRALDAAGEVVLVRGASTMAGVRAMEKGGRPASLWHHDWSPHVFEAVFPGDAITSIILQPSEEKAGRVLRLETRTGKVVQTFILAGPRTEESRNKDGDWDERYPVRRLTYEQKQIVDDEHGLRVSADGVETPLAANSIRVLDQVGDSLFAEIGYYWALVNLETGKATMLSPLDDSSDSTRNTPEEGRIVEWLRTHKGHDRIADPHFVFAAAGLKHIPPDPQDEGPLARHEFLADAAGHRIALGMIRPWKADVLGEWLLFNCRAGALILHHGSRAANVAEKASAQKTVSHLFSPPNVLPGGSEGLVLDGDLADWPRDRFCEMTAGGQFWPSSDGSNAANGSPPKTPKVSFQWAMDEAVIWLAVRVADEMPPSEPGERCAKSHQIEVTMSKPSPSDDGHWPGWPEAERLMMTLKLVDGLPLAWIELPERQPLFAKPVGMESLLDTWPKHGHADALPWADGFDSAAVLTPGGVDYELRIERRLFRRIKPEGFDIRVSGGDGTEAFWSLEWGGAVHDGEHCPIARWESGP